MFTSPRETAASKEAMDNEGSMRNEKEKIRSLKEEGMQHANAVKDDVEETARRVGRHAREFTDSAGHNLSELAEALANRIHKKPVQTIASIVGVGFIFGFLVRSSR